MPADNPRTDQRLQVGYGSAWHLLRCLGWQRERFSGYVAEAIGAESVTWLDFTEYSGKQVYPKGNPILDGEWQRLDFLGGDHPLQKEYDRFWPRGGSQQSWDAVGTAFFHGQREWVLVEAKAHTGEIKDEACKAVSSRSKSMIREAFEKTQRGIGSTVPTTVWLNHFYQYANRLSTTYFLNDHQLPTRLVMIYFCGDSYHAGECPRCAEEWEPTLDQIRLTLGLTGTSDLERRISEVFVPVDLTGSAGHLMGED